MGGLWHCFNHIMALIIANKPGNITSFSGQQRPQTADSGLGKAVPEMVSMGSHCRYCRGLSSRAGKTAVSLHVGDDVVLEAGRQTPAMPLKLYCELPLGHWRQARLRTFGNGHFTWHLGPGVAKILARIARTRAMAMDRLQLWNTLHASFDFWQYNSLQNRKVSRESKPHPWCPQS